MVIMWKVVTKRFAIRLALCLIVFGGLYSLIVSLAHSPHRLSSDQKVAALYSALDQVYISGQNLALFNETDSVAGVHLSQQFAQFQTSLSDLDQRLHTSPSGLVSAQMRQQIAAVLVQQQKAAVVFKATYQVVAQPLSYEPATDLGTVYLTSNQQLLQTRAQASQKGLMKASDNQATIASSSTTGLVAQNTQHAPPILPENTRLSLQHMSDCFGQIATQSAAHQMAVNATRARCIADYQSLRKTILQTLLAASFNDTYKGTAVSTIPPLLQKLSR